MTAKLMLVEDDTNLSDIYKARFEAEGFQVTAAKDGEEALALAVKEKPDLIISDIMMPKISGFEMLDILRGTESIKATKVIMMTALGQAEDKARAEKLGADRYLVKSQVTLEDVVKAVHEVLSAAPSQTPTATAPAAGNQTPSSTPSPVSVASPSTSTANPASPPATAAPVMPATPQTDNKDSSTPASPLPTTNATNPASPPATPAAIVINVPVVTPASTGSNQPAAASNDSSEPSSAPILPTKTIEELETASQAVAKSDGALGKPASVAPATTPTANSSIITPTAVTPAAAPPANNGQSAALTEIRNFVNQAEAKSQAKADEDNAARTVKVVEPSAPTSQPPTVKTSDDLATDKVSIANKKIIEPVTDGKPKFDIEKALAAEENIGQDKPENQLNSTVSNSPASSPAKPSAPQTTTLEPLTPTAPPASSSVVTGSDSQPTVS